MKIVGYVQSLFLDNRALEIGQLLNSSLEEVWIAVPDNCDDNKHKILPKGLGLYPGREHPYLRILDFYDKFLPDAIFRIPSDCPPSMISHEIIEEMIRVFEQEKADFCYNPQFVDSVFYEITGNRPFETLKKKVPNPITTPVNSFRHYHAILPNYFNLNVTNIGNAEQREIQKEVDSVSWFHEIDFGNGVKSRAYSPNHNLIEDYGNFDNLSGKRVLDIAMADGLFSFLAEKRGAREVIGTEIKYLQEHDLGEGEAKKGFYGTIERVEGKGNVASHSAKSFQIAKKILRSKVKRLEIPVYELDPEKIGMFDVVFFFGLLYHLLNPMLALEKIRKVCKGEMLLQTVIDDDKSEKKIMSFTEGIYLVPDSNPRSHAHWWTPNMACLKAMLRTSGFSKIKEVKVSSGFASLLCS